MKVTRYSNRIILHIIIQCAQVLAFEMTSISEFLIYFLMKQHVFQHKIQCVLFRFMTFINTP